MKIYKILPFVFLTIFSRITAQNTFPATGNVGIGTTSPSEKLTVSGNVLINGALYSNSQITNGFNTNGSSTYNQFRNNGTNIGIIGSLGSMIGSDPLDFGMWVYGSNNYRLYTNGSERLRITGNGNVGIGTTIPNGAIDIIGSSSASRFVVGYNGTGDNYLDGATSYIRLANGTEIARFNSTGLGIGGISPQYKLDVNGTTNNVALRVNAGGVNIGDGSGFLGFHFSNMLPNQQYFTGFAHNNSAGNFDIKSAGRLGLYFSNNTLYPFRIYSQSWNTGTSSYDLTERLKIDGSNGSTTISGDVTTKTLLTGDVYAKNQTTPTTFGYSSLRQGTSTYGGYVEFIRPNQTRGGFIGTSDATQGIRYAIENGGTHNFVGANIDINSNKIVNLANGTASTDAVNLGQLTSSSLSTAQDFQIGNRYATKEWRKTITMSNGWVANDYWDLITISQGSLQGVLELNGIFEGSGYGQTIYAELPISYNMDWYSSVNGTSLSNDVWYEIPFRCFSTRHLISDENSISLLFKIPSSNQNSIQLRLKVNTNNNSGSPIFKFALKYKGVINDAALVNMTTTGNDPTPYVPLRIMDIVGAKNSTIAIPNKLTVKNNVSIGLPSNAASPSGYKLAIGGNALAEKMVVKLQTNWPDYVFHSDYILPPLSQVEEHIKAKGHLPNIPTEKEVKETGIDLGDMNAKLLQKIEELTLYLIEIERKVQLLQEEIKKLKSK